MEINKFINRLFESREQAHVYHLQSEEYSKHIALEEYYEKIIKLIDELVEVYQGQYDIIEDYTLIKSNDIDKTDVIKYFKELATFIQDNRGDVFKKEDTHLLSIVDDILIIVFKTTYKLRFLK